MISYITPEPLIGKRVFPSKPTRKISPEQLVLHDHEYAARNMEFAGYNMDDFRAMHSLPAAKPKKSSWSDDLSVPKK